MVKGGWVGTAPDVFTNHASRFSEFALKGVMSNLQPLLARVCHFQRHAKFAHAWVPLPTILSGQRASMRNGLGLSLWSGSRQAQAAWQWLRYASSGVCQARIAEAGVDYPAIKGLAEVAVAAQRGKGVDASAFLAPARGPIFAPPVVPRAAEVNDLMTSVLERVLSGRTQAALPEAVCVNSRVSPEQPRTTMAQIDFQYVSKRYAPALSLVIKGVDLQVAHSEFCVFVGPSGCGKSTLLRMVAGLEDITEGELRINGRRVTHRHALP